MGRIFEVRKHAMFARWNRMAKQFARIAKDINMAVKAGGSDPGSNPTLRRVIQNARAANMPKDKVEAAIKRAVGKDATHYEQVLYEGYAPHGVAVLVETATDNPTRTVAHVRSIFAKGGGNLGASGSVAFQFRRMGVFRLKPDGIDQDDLELYLIDHGLDEMGEGSGEAGEPQIVIRCAFGDFGRMQLALEARGLVPVSAEQEYVCTVPVELPEPEANEALALIDSLEQDDDVQRVYHTLA
ncbi:MAG: putative transcriptional regulatory protein [Steroidobacteraceae bacterium]|nr:putative transcriptional regulatory protein [Steroidobacteraceae bacterium]